MSNKGCATAPSCRSLGHECCLDLIEKLHWRGILKVYDDIKSIRKNQVVVEVLGRIRIVICYRNLPERMRSKHPISKRVSASYSSQVTSFNGIKSSIPLPCSIVVKGMTGL